MKNIAANTSSAEAATSATSAARLTRTARLLASTIVTLIIAPSLSLATSKSATRSPAAEADGKFPPPYRTQPYLQQAQKLGQSVGVNGRIGATYYSGTLVAEALALNSHLDQLGSPYRVRLARISPAGVVELPSSTVQIGRVYQTSAPLAARGRALVVPLHRANRVAAELAMRHIAQPEEVANLGASLRRLLDSRAAESIRIVYRYAGVVRPEVIHLRTATVNVSTPNELGKAMAKLLTAKTFTIDISYETSLWRNLTAITATRNPREYVEQINRRILDQHRQLAEFEWQSQQPIPRNSALARLQTKPRLFTGKGAGVAGAVGSAVVILVIYNYLGEPNSVPAAIDSVTARLATLAQQQPRKVISYDEWCRQNPDAGCGATQHGQQIQESQQADSQPTDSQQTEAVYQ